MARVGRGWAAVGDGVKSGSGVEKAGTVVEGAALAPPHRDERLTVIRPSSRWPRLDLLEIWRFRELFLTLVWRDIAVRYKQTAIGAAWAILQPVMLMIVMTLVFGKFAKFDSEGFPYPIFNYSGLLPWLFFAGALTLTSGSVLTNRNLVTKVYFPRIILPAAGVLVPLVDMVLASSVLVGMMFWFGVFPGAAIVFAPLFLVLALLTAFGVGLWFAALGVRYRDVPLIVPFVIQLWFWLSAVAYSPRSLADAYQWIFALNPMNGVIQGFRWSFLDTPAPGLGQLALSAGAAIVLVVTGAAFFRASESGFADTI
ncbi:MAG: ABC transporter permease [Gaiella sp.]